MKNTPRLAILGGTVTALAVARNAARLGMRPVLFDTWRDVATSTRRADVRIVADARGVLDELLRLAEAEPMWLVATSDTWLRFVMAHREPLTAVFDRVLHPANRAIEICLGKAMFVDWCESHGLRTVGRCDPVALIEEGGALPFPVLLRPSQTDHEHTDTVPKAAEARNRSELIGWMGVFEKAGVLPLVTRSLLGHRLVQFSVGAARRDRALVSFVAIKTRPLPEACAVGTYVEISPDSAVAALARDALEAMDFQGIGEVEILRDLDSGTDHLIEINPRPWVQYALAPASGHDLLSFLLDPEHFVVRHARRRRSCWIDMTSDLFTCFSRSVGIVRHGRLRWGSYLASLLRANTYAYFSTVDPAPAWRNLRDFVARTLRRPRTP